MQLWNGQRHQASAQQLVKNTQSDSFTKAFPYSWLDQGWNRRKRYPEERSRSSSKALTNCQKHRKLLLYQIFPPSHGMTKAPNASRGGVPKVPEASKVSSDKGEEGHNNSSKAQNATSVPKLPP